MTLTAPSLPFSSSVVFSGLGISTPVAGPNMLRVIQKEFEHDIAVLQFWGGDVDADALTSGSPMLLTFGNATFQRAFYGYVNHPTRTNNSLAGATLVERNAVTITCVGASWPMKQTSNQVFTSMTASQIVQQIADLFGLATDIVPDTTIWPSRAMAGMTYWQFCVSLAQLIGYTFYCNGVQLVFKPRQTNPLTMPGLAAVYDYRSNIAGLPVFTPTLGATNPYGGQLANRQAAGIDPRTLNAVYASVSGTPSVPALGATSVVPPFNKLEHFPINTQQEADVKANGAAALNQLFITATATAVGNPQVSQGSLVFVQNANGSQNGLWFVTMAKHTMDTQTYAMSLDVGRDSLGSTATIGIIQRTTATPQARLVNGSWVAV